MLKGHGLGLDDGGIEQHVPPCLDRVDPPALQVAGLSGPPTGFGKTGIAQWPETHLAGTTGHHEAERPRRHPGPADRQIQTVAVGMRAAGDTLFRRLGDIILGETFIGASHYLYSGKPLGQTLDPTHEIIPGCSEPMRTLQDQ